MGDVRTELARPHLRIRNGASKGGRPRMVPLWWDAGTLADLSAWKNDASGNAHVAEDSFVASLRPSRAGTLFSRHTLRKRFRTACKVLGAERLKSLTIHHGRHTFISHALAGGRTLAEVRDAVGHSNVSITSAYQMSPWTTNRDWGVSSSSSVDADRPPPITFWQNGVCPSKRFFL